MASFTMSWSSLLFLESVLERRGGAETSVHPSEEEVSIQCHVWY